MIERTLVDIVVRPEYSGGVRRVLGVFRMSKAKASINKILKILTHFDHFYPYHQALGFYLERAGFANDDLHHFVDLGTPVDFYLGYGEERTAYDKRWRLYYPRSLEQT